MSMNPFTFPLEAQRRAVEMATDAVDRSRVAPDRTETVATVEVGGTPSEVVYEENKLELHRYDPETVGAEKEHEVPILVVYALINRPYILDLQEERSVIRRLLENGFEVYMIDWGEPSQLDTSLTLDDYVNRYTDNCVDVVRERAGVDAVNVLGYCMGGTMSVMYTALHPEKVRNLGLMAAGLCFAGTGGVLEMWGNEDYYDPEKVVETFGNVPADFLDVGFALMDPVNNYVAKYVNLYENIEDEDFVENFARMERWLDDGIDVAGEAYREFLEDVYQENALYENTLEIGGERVDLDELDLPILQVIGKYDHLIPPEASKPFNDRVPSDDVTTMEFSTGHIGLSVSSSSHAELWPQVAEWYAERSTVEAAGDDFDEEAAVEVDVESPDESEEAVDESEEAVDESEEAVDESEEAVDAGDDLESLSGIGPAYAEQLREAGVTSVAELAAADPVELAGPTDIGEGRLRTLVRRASEAVAE